MKRAKQKFKHLTRPQFELYIDLGHGQFIVPESRQITQWARAALRPGIKHAEIGIRIVDEAEGQQLNRDYRNKDYATNVLTFALTEDEPLTSGLPLLGDIVLTAPVVLREASEQGKTPQAHYAHLIVHGMLHLQGYDHLVEAEAEEMEALESAIVIRLGFADPYGKEPV